MINLHTLFDFKTFFRLRLALSVGAWYGAQICLSAEAIGESG